jgi:hypothetical protein
MHGMRGAVIFVLRKQERSPPMCHIRARQGRELNPPVGDVTRGRL